MKAVQVKPPGNIEDLYIDENVAKPSPTEHHVIIKVYATAINRADTLQRRGLYPAPAGASDILGLEAAGTIAAVGSDVTKWKAGDRVMALLSGGGNAQFVCAHENLLLPVPKSMSYEDAAAIPEVWLTAFQLLSFVGNMKDGESVLIHAGGSGVGTAAVQLARHVFNSTRIFVTAGHQDKIDYAEKLGAKAGFNYKEGNFAEKLLAATNGEGVDLLLDCVGANLWQQNVDCVKTDGRWVLYGLLGGANISGDLLSHILRKRLTIKGTTLRARSVEYKSQLVERFSTVALPLFESGKLVPIVHKVFPIEQIQDSHRMMESGDNIGKIVLRVVQDDDVSVKSDL